MVASPRPPETPNHRVYKRWITEPGHWLQWDYGDGPVVGGLSTVLLLCLVGLVCFRVIISLADRSWPSVVAPLDQTF